MLTEDHLQAPYNNATLCVKARQMWCLLSFEGPYIIVYHNYDAPTLSPTHSCIHIHSNWSKKFLHRSHESHAY